MNGIEHIQTAFSKARNENRPALMPYFTLGYPDLEMSIHIIQSIAEAGVDLIELGIPFSDPLADGPTIQHSTQIALEKGADVVYCLESVKKLRDSGCHLPFLFMGYINPILSYGIEKFVLDAKNVGVDGLIIPDLPPEEADGLNQLCQMNGLALIFMIAPTTSNARIKMIVDKAVGFLYLVSLAGVTGVRQQLPDYLGTFIQEVRKLTQIPLSVGFGISTPDQANQVGRMADGVIIGSALIEAVEKSLHPEQAAYDFIIKIKTGIEKLK
jgi:tryptophan synthase alpha chain